MHTRPRPQCADSAGFSYVGVLVAIVLLAVCAAPAADAVRNASAATAVSGVQLRALLCLKSRMETVAAEPYQKLLNAAAGTATAAQPYSLPEDSLCPERKVYIARVSVDVEGAATYPATDTGLLQLVVALPDPSGAAPAQMSLATMVLR